MKIILFVLAVLCLNWSFGSTANMRSIPSELLVNGLITDLSDIKIINEGTKEKVALLFSQNKLNHDLTKYISPDADFELYWEAFGSYWFEVALENPRSNHLVFNGFSFYEESKEVFEIFQFDEHQNGSKIYMELGNVIGYKRHPRTKEIILYVHNYPCCKSASHSLFRVRSINNTIKVKERFFVGRDSGDMVGPFFPDTTVFPSSVDTLKKEVLLRWSPIIIDSGAFEGRAETNQIIHFKVNALFIELGEKENWKYVLFLNGIKEEMSAVLHYSNFLRKPIYGWVRKEEFE